jgi:hypothetical protein
MLRNDIPEPEDRQALPKNGPSENNEPLPTFVTSPGVRKMRLEESLLWRVFDPCRLVRQVKEFGWLASELLHLPHKAAGVEPKFDAEG